jgi:hypothetical protein
MDELEGPLRDGDVEVDVMTAPAETGIPRARTAVLLQAALLGSKR